MDEASTEKFIRQLLQLADIRINGNNPWDIQVYNKQFYSRILREQSMGLGESYMEKWWDCQRLDQFFERVFRANIEDKVKANTLTVLKLLFLTFVNQQTKKRSLVVGQKHYDLGNDLFENMLDNRMNYTCGYWNDTNNLDDAQLNKLQLTCQKLMLKPGMRLLDIGCGFGSFAKYAAENFGVEVVGVTISEQQCEYAKNNCKGLPVEIRFQDYRDVDDKFDRIVSLGMFEHVGHLNYRQYMQKVRHCLNDDGLFLLHTIGNTISQVTTDPWIAKYIFPNGMLPSIAQIGSSSEETLLMEDWHNFGADYDKTLMAWHKNITLNSDHLTEKYDERFFRMWNYYLLSSAASFRTRRINLWQIVFSKNGVMGGYQRPLLQFSDEKLDAVG